MRKCIRVFILLSMMTVATSMPQGCSSGLSNAAVISFDDLPEIDYDISKVPPGYKGITWGTSVKNVSGGGHEFGKWHYRASHNCKVDNPMAHSSPNYVFNLHGVNNLWFSFPEPVKFNGAWFSYLYKPTSAVAVRFRDNQGNVSPWLKLSEKPQFLDADFQGSTTIYVETSGQNKLERDDSWWYAMDDIIYNEPVPPVFIPTREECWTEQRIPDQNR
jgi:hypothetical protein